MLQYWDDAKDQVIVGYHRSSFYGHSKTTKLIKELGNLISLLDPVKLSKSIYGPSVCLKLRRNNEEEIMKGCKENLFHSLIDIGTCSLYTVCGAVKTEFKSSIMNV